MVWAIQVSNPGRGTIFFSYSIRPDRIWGSPRFLRILSEKVELSYPGWSGHGV